MHPEIVTIKADKGNTTVIMKRSEYIEKTKQLLDDDAIYRTTNKDPIKALQKTITLLLMKWKNHKFITDGIYQILKPENCNLARIYCLPTTPKITTLSDLSFPR